MPKKTTKTADTDTAKEPRPALVAKGHGGRALLALVRLLLLERAGGRDWAQARKELLVEGFLQGSAYGSDDFAALWTLERDIANVLIDACGIELGDSRYSRANKEATELAQQLVANVFDLKRLLLKDLAPKGLSEAVRSSTAERAAEQRAAQARAKQRATKAKGGRTAANPKREGPKASTAASKRPKAGATPASSTEPKKRGRPRKADAAAPPSPPATQPSLPGVVDPAKRGPAAASPAPTGRGHQAAGRGADDPLYGSAVLRMKGRTPTAISELARELGIGNERAGRIVAAMKERGDWPLGATPPERGIGGLASPPGKGRGRGRKPKVNDGDVPRPGELDPDDEELFDGDEDGGGR